jgi:hypothetical protein
MLAAAACGFKPGRQVGFYDEGHEPSGARQPAEGSPKGSAEALATQDMKAIQGDSARADGGAARTEEAAGPIRVFRENPAAAGGGLRAAGRGLGRTRSASFPTRVARPRAGGSRSLQESRWIPRQSSDWWKGMPCARLEPPAPCAEIAAQMVERSERRTAFPPGGQPSPDG